MIRLCRLALVACLPLPAAAQDQPPAGAERPLTAAEFAAFVEGRTMDTHGADGLLGVETFLPEGRTRWRDPDHCLHGSWTQVGDMICYTYDGEEGRFCSSFYDRGDWLIGFRDGIWGKDPIMLTPSDDVVTCEPLLGS